MKDQNSLKLIIRKSIRHFFLISFLIFIFISCATFQSKQRLDLSPFANSMISVAGDIQYSLFQHRLVAVRKLAKGPEVEKFALYIDKLRRVIRGIIAYSIEIVTVSESNKSGKEKANALADYLESLKQPILEKPIQEFHFTVGQLDTIIMNVRSQKKFLDALGAAQPLIDEVARANGELTEESKTQLDVAYQEIVEAWNNEYSNAIWAMDIIKNMQFRQLLAGYHAGQYLRTDNQSSLDSFYVYDPISRKLYGEGHQLDAEDILEVEKRIYYNLTVIQDMKLLYQQDMIDYEEGLLELDKTKQVYNNALRKARIAILMWSRAHLQLSRGVTEPAAIDIMQLMLGTARKVVPGL